MNRKAKEHFIDLGRKKPQISAGNGKRWEPIWEMTDEFWRPELQPMWEACNPNWSGRQPAFFKESNVVVKSHRLQLWSREDQPQSAYLLHKGYRNFSTAFVRSKHVQCYGYFEIFCKLMDSKISSNFWLSHNEPTGFDSWWTEIDVFKYSAADQHRSVIHTNLHVHRNGKWKGNPHLARPESFDSKMDLCKEPHKFGLDWTKDYITWYFDDKPIRSIPNYYHHRPMHIQFNTETFPKWFGLPKVGGSYRNKLPNSFEIYYIRSWKRSPIRTMST